MIVPHPITSLMAPRYVDMCTAASTHRRTLNSGVRNTHAVTGTGARLPPAASALHLVDRQPDWLWVGARRCSPRAPDSG